MVRSNKMRLGFLLVSSILFISPTVSLGISLNNDTFELSREGAGLMFEGKPAQALIYLDQALALDENDSYNWALKGNAHYQLGDFRKAAYAYLRSLDIDPTQRKVWTYLGLVQYRMSEYERAAQSYGIALELDPYDKGLWLQEGAALFQSGEYEKASEAFGNAIKLDPFYYDAIDNKKMVDDLIWERQVKIITAIVIIISIPAVYIIIRRQKRKN